MEQREIKIRIIDPKTKKVIGYESWDITFGWAFVMLPDETVRAGTFPDGVDRNIRNLSTGLIDKNLKLTTQQT